VWINRSSRRLSAAFHQWQTKAPAMSASCPLALPCDDQRVPLREVESEPRQASPMNSGVSISSPGRSVSMVYPAVIRSAVWSSLGASGENPASMVPLSSVRRVDSGSARRQRLNDRQFGRSKQVSGLVTRAHENRRFRVREVALGETPPGTPNASERGHILTSPTEEIVAAWFTIHTYAQ
jgi:hypothetical protein